MELFHYEIELDPHKVPYTLIFTGDWHLGHGACDSNKVRRLTETIAGLDSVGVFFMGDAIEAISPTDPRFDAYSMDEEFKCHIGRIIDRQYEEVKSLLWPIRDKIILIHEGNHEQKIRRQHFRDITLDLCRELRQLDRPFYGKYSAITRLHFRLYKGGGSRTFIVLTSHGSGSGRKKGAKVNTLTDFAASFSNVAIFAMGHTHDRMIVPDVSLGIPHRGKLKLQENEHLLINTGTYLKTYHAGVSNYAEQRMYPPSSLGSVGVHIWPTERRFEGFYL
jgi:hypothetical protein